MVRVHVICEGQTEEMFVNQVLSPYFSSKGIYLIPSLLGKPGHKGGNVNLQRMLTDVSTRLKSDTTAYCTTFFDFYGLDSDFPGKNEAASLSNINEKATSINDSLENKIKDNVGEDFSRRFIPYVQMYEFEGLLFSNPEALAESIGCSDTTTEFKSIRDEFSSPEEINNSPRTAPSKRIKSLCYDYDKVVYGSIAAMDIGLETIRQECKIFDEWLKKIEGLSNASN